jgi:hypothetical protein
VLTTRDINAEDPGSTGRLKSATTTIPPAESDCAIIAELEAAEAERNPPATIKNNEKQSKTSSLLE